MIARNLIADIPPLTPEDPVSMALEWMDDFHIRHLPVVDTGVLLGILSEETCLDHPEAQSVRDLTSEIPQHFLFEHRHLYDAVKLIAEQSLTAVPVLDREGKYIGMVTMESLLRYFAETGSVAHPGGIVILDVDHRKYALSEIARIVESENARVLSSNISSLPGAELLEVTLKLNTEDIQHVVATLERFGYSVRAAFYEETYLNPLRERYDMLMSYLRV